MKHFFKPVIVTVVSLLCACEPEVSRDYPLVITMPVKDINHEGATLVGTLGAEHFSDVINCGFVWSPLVFYPDDAYLESFSTTIDLGKPGERTFEARVDAYLGVGNNYTVRAFVQTASQKVFGVPVNFLSQGSSKSAILIDFTPKVAKPNDTITITGKYFGPTTSDKFVRFGEDFIATARPFFVSDSVLKVAVPARVKPQDCILSISTSQGILRTTDQLRVIVPYWTQLQPFPGTRQYYPASFAIDSFGYMGLDAFSSEFWQYNPASDTWTQMADFPGHTRNGATYFVVGSKGYVGLGFGPNNEVYNDFWEFDPASNSWTQLNNFPGEHTQMLIQFAIGSKGYAGSNIGGSFWEYDPASDTWTARATVAGASEFCMGSFGYNSKGYAVSSSGLYVFDPAGNEWSLLPASNATSFYASPVLVFPSGVAYLIGHANLRIDVNTNSWILTAPPPNLQDAAGAFGFVVGTKGYVGEDIVYELDPSKE